MAEEPLRRTAWHSVDEAKEGPIVLAIPESLNRYLGNRQAQKMQTTIKIQQFTPERFRISQRSPEGVLLREIVLDILPDMKNAQIRGYQMQLVKVGKDWKCEELQPALYDMAKEIILPEG